MSDAATFRPPYRYEASEHGPVTIYDSVDVGWIARVKESLPHKEALAAAMVEGLNAAAGRVTEREGARLLTGGSGDESDAGSIPAPSALHTDSTDLQTCGDSGSAASDRRFVTYDETGEEREVVGYCPTCRATPDEDVMLVSPQGVAHHAEMDTTDCGHNATGDGWWWRL